MRRSLALVAAVPASLVFLSACSDQLPSAASPESATQPSLSAFGGGAPEFVPGEVIVKFREGADEAARGNALRATSATVRERIVTAAMRRAGDAEGLTLVHSPLGTAAAIERLRGNPDVEYAEPNWVYRHNATSNDPAYTNGSLWGMYGDATSPANQYGSQAGEAWAADHTDCGTVYVGIIDEGYYYDHEDLQANAGTNPGETANGVDDDGNGYVDDVYGWDFDGNDNTVFDGTQDDHGTHVAGTIGGVGGNSKGVAGVCWSVKLLNAKFLGRFGGTTANAIKAVDYFTDMKTRTVKPVNLVATSNSWGGGGFSQGLQDAIERANAAEILFVAAAGNDSKDCDSGSNSCYPAEYPNANIIAVASITSSGAMSSFSNFGATTIDIGAPGSSIYSTVPKSSKGKIVSGYASYSGTSMATPHVSGAAALYKAYHSAATAAEVKDAIRISTILTGSLSGKTVTGGRLNVSGF
ncbi:MAG: S8 family serine peptidase [Gemmatimonadota bacterium]|nr:S8 family serine peptidase [Gemmatimonadota bacterium]